MEIKPTTSAPARPAAPSPRVVTPQAPPAGEAPPADTVELSTEARQAMAGNAGYPVQPGDTLSDLAQQWGTTVDDLARTNGIADPDLIQVGQNLERPSVGTAGPVPAAPANSELAAALAGATPVAGAAEALAAEHASGNDPIRLSENYREQTVPQIVNVNGVAIPVYGVRNEGELAAITQTLQNSAGVSPEVLNGVTQINLYEEARFDSPAFYGNNQIFVKRPVPGGDYFPNLNHEFGHLVDDAVNGQRLGKFGVGDSANSYGVTGGATEDFAVSFDYATAGFVEGQVPDAATDPEVQAKVRAALAALAEYRAQHPLEANIAAA